MSLPIRIVNASNEGAPSEPVRIVNWDAFIQAVIAAIETGNVDVLRAQQAYIGDVAGGNYTYIAADGTVRAYGDATCWLDEMQNITGAKIDSPSADFELSNANGTVLAKTSARYPADFVWGSWQLNHDWEPGTPIHPHMHWWQTTANVPHWLFAYRWQKSNAEATTVWTLKPWTVNAYAYAGQTRLNQITEFGTITPPVGYGVVSDIIQIRLYRDYTNVSTLFTGNDPVNATQEFLNVDGHKRANQLGSPTEYNK